MSPIIDELYVGYSKFKLARLLLVGIGLTLLCASIAFHWIPGIRGGSKAQFLGYAGLLIFGLAVGVILWRLATAHRDVVVLSPSGLTDLRISKEKISWLAIRQIRVFTMNRQKFILLDLDSTAESDLCLTWIAKWSRELNRRFGADGLCVTAGDLTISHHDLLNAIVVRWAAARGSASTIEKF